MIIHNLYVVSMAFLPFKTNAPLIVNANTMLTSAVRFQSSRRSYPSFILDIKLPRQYVLGAMFELNLQRAVLKDRYEVRGRISSGSYAEVFVARDRDSGNVVVIKALNSHLQGTPYPELEEMLA